MLFYRGVVNSTIVLYYHYCVEELLVCSSIFCTALETMKRTKLTKTKEKFSATRKARYFLTEPKTNKKELYVHLKYSIASKLFRAFKASRQPLAAKIKISKLAKAIRI